jgi:hypothetical protein
MIIICLIINNKFIWGGLREKKEKNFTVLLLYDFCSDFFPGNSHLWFE